MLIDTHTHLYQPAFDADIEAMFQRAKAVGVQQFYLPAIDSESTDRLLHLEAAHPGVCKAMMGLHPCSVNETVEKELANVKRWLAERRFAAVGEIGLDFYWDKTFAAQQLMAFDLQMNWALDYKLPIVIHSRNATVETLEAVRPFAMRGLRGIFHCFSGTAAEAQQVVDLGFLLGIGGVVTYKNSGLAQSIAEIGLQHLVLETDAPYLAPVPYRGKRNESSYLPLVAATLAQVYGVAVEEVARHTAQNAQKLFAY